MNMVRLADLRTRPHTITQEEVRLLLRQHEHMLSALDRIGGTANMGINAGVAAINIARSAAAHVRSE